MINRYNSLIDTTRNKYHTPFSLRVVLMLMIKSREFPLSLLCADSDPSSNVTHLEGKRLGERE